MRAAAAEAIGHELGDEAVHTRESESFDTRPAGLRSVAARCSVLAVVAGLGACSVVPSNPFPAAAQPDPGSVSMRQVDGGPDYYERFENSLPTDPGFFPIAVWSESVVDDTGWPVDKAAGINTYLEPTADTDLPRIDLHGMHVISSRAAESDVPEGYFTVDEPDLWAGPGDAEWTGNQPGQGDICVPADAECGYSVMEAAVASAPPGRLRMTNFGKGLVYWETNDEAARFLNDYQDVVSADVYWYTDPNVCGGNEGGGLLAGGAALDDDTCRLAENYGRTVERVRSLIEPRGSMPVWNFVEVGHPFIEEDAPTITVPEIRAAVWHSLIAGARGIVYFVHNFAGSCQTQHAIRDCGPELQDGVAAINAQVESLAPVLNAPFVDGLVSSDDAVSLSTKLFDGSLYVLAGSAVAEPHSSSITVGCDVGTAVVVDEDRTVPIVGGEFVDDFADRNAVHIYRIDGAGKCLAG